MKKYNSYIPPCGIFCGGCPVYSRGKNPCLGAKEHCENRRCKGIYVCCVENKEKDFCYECAIFPCSRFKKFAKTWEKYGQDLIKNQEELKTMGSDKWLKKWNQKVDQEKSQK